MTELREDNLNDDVNGFEWSFRQSGTLLYKLTCTAEAGPYETSDDVGILSWTWVQPAPLLLLAILLSEDSDESRLLGQFDVPVCVPSISWHFLFLSRL